MIYLRAFQRETAKRCACNGEITACAGIALVKTHYPFARAYMLADDLYRNAKRYRQQQGLDGACLDWHFALSGLSGGIDDIREREYRVREGWLTLRPVALGDNPQQTHRTWDIIHKGIMAFQGPNWAGRHNKVKALRDALREGSDAVSHFRLKFNQTHDDPQGLLPNLGQTQTDWCSNGWWGRYCGYFDAIELADWFVPLAPRGIGHEARTAPAAQE